MPCRGSDHGYEHLGEGLALEVVKRKRGSQGVAGSGCGRSPETGSCSSKHTPGRGIGSEKVCLKY